MSLKNAYIQKQKYNVEHINLMYGYIPDVNSIKTKANKIFPLSYKKKKEKNAWHIDNSQCSKGCVFFLALPLTGHVTLVQWPDLANKTTVH